MTTPASSNSLGHDLARLGAIALGACLLAVSCGAPSTVQDAVPAAPTTATAAVDSPTTAAAPEASDEQPDELGDVTAYLDRLEDSDFSGVVAVDDGSRTVIRSYGQADRDGDTPVVDDTVFDIGSITKQFTAAAILRLEMDGLVSVDAPVSTYVEGLPPDKAGITLHQLLTHSAGLPPSLGGDYEPVGRDQIVQLIADAELLDPPGERYTYSNAGYSLLAVVIEVVTGDSYEQYLHDELFTPAGMADTGYRIPAWDPDRVAIGYDDRGEPFGRPNDQRWDDDGPYWHLRGNGGLLATAADMLAWHDALLSDEILDEDARTKLFGSHIAEGPGAGSHYGYGWSIVPLEGGRTLVTHNGGNGIFFADFLRFVDDELTIFIATNAADAEAEAIPFELADLVLDTNLAAQNGGGDDPCGFGQWSPDDLPPGETIDVLPATGPGDVADLLLAVLGGDDDRRGELAELIDPSLTGGATTDEVEAEIELLQDEVAGHELVDIIQPAPNEFHFLLRLPADMVLVSIATSEQEPNLLTCVGVSYP